MSLAADPELDEAFGPATAAPSAPTSLDSELDAAFGPPPARAAVANKPTSPYADRPVISDAVDNQLHELGSGMLHGVVGGYKGLVTLATSRDPDKAAAAVEAETAKAYHAPVSPYVSTMAPAARKAWESGTQLPAATELGDIAERHGASPALSTGLAVLPAAAAASLGAPRGGLGEAPKLTPTGAPEAQAVVNKASESQSMGAAGTPIDVSEASPQGKAAIAAADPAKLDSAALQNHLEAERHGVQLSRGQANRDPVQYSNEQNSTLGAKQLAAQEDQLVNGIDDIRRDASPSTVHNNVIQNGQTVVDSLKAYDEPVQANIRAKYKALEDANGGSLPIDTGSFVSNVDAILKKRFLTGSVPAAGKELLDSLRAGEPLDFEGFEEARSRLAEAQRNGGSEGTAAKAIRAQLEQMPLAPEAAKLKGLADEARGAARSRFEELEADPAYQAAVDDVAGGIKKGQSSPLADKFLDSHALGNAPKSQVDLMMSKLDDEGRGAVASHTLNAIRKSGVNSTGKVVPKGYSDALAKYGPKLDSLVAPETRQGLEEMGHVINNAKVAPPGNFVNYSKSGVIMNAAQHAGEAAINAKTLGIGVPFIKGALERKFIDDAWSPYAGIEKR
jgi:hypothetical protein